MNLNLNTYDIGNLITTNVKFTTSAGVPADPTTVTLKVQPPGIPAVSYTGSELTKNAVGDYSYEINANIAGVWSYRWIGEGAIVAAQDSAFKIISSNLYP